MPFIMIVEGKQMNNCCSKNGDEVMGIPLGMQKQCCADTVGQLRRWIRLSSHFLEDTHNLPLDPISALKAKMLSWLARIMT